MIGLIGAGCAPDDRGGEASAGVPDFASARIAPPPGAEPGSCWVRDIAPAEIETVTRQVEVMPGDADGGGARYRTETAQRIVRERAEVIFETPCPDMLTPELVRSLQRALSARGLYRGTVSGEMDLATRRAVRRYQAARNLPSGLLSLSTARALGLVATPRQEL
nr:peptidoglycan-binding domain-containing protein [Marivita sp. GX14005]